MIAAKISADGLNGDDRK